MVFLPSHYLPVRFPFLASQFIPHGTDHQHRIDRPSCNSHFSTMEKKVYHPNVLSAIVTARIQFQEITTARTSTIIETINIQTPELTRFVILLDALASLSVSKPDGQVVAIALHKVGDPITLTVAQNEAVPPALIRYLQRLVTMASEYSQLSAANDKERMLKQLEITKAVYIYCDRKISQRFVKRKWLQPFEKALHAHAMDLGVHASVCLELVSSLMKVRETFDTIHEWQTIKTHQPGRYDTMTPANQVPDEDWEKLILVMDGSMPDIKLLLDNKLGCDSLAFQLRGTYY